MLSLLITSPEHFRGVYDGLSTDEHGGKDEPFFGCEHLEDEENGPDGPGQVLARNELAET